MAELIGDLIDYRINRLKINFNQLLLSINMSKVIDEATGKSKWLEFIN